MVCPPSESGSLGSGNAEPHRSCLHVHACLSGCSFMSIFGFCICMCIYCIYIYIYIYRCTFMYLFVYISISIRTLDVVWCLVVLAVRSSLDAYVMLQRCKS